MAYALSAAGVMVLSLSQSSGCSDADRDLMGRMGGTSHQRTHQLNGTEEEEMTRSTIMAVTMLVALGFAPAMAQEDGAKPETTPETKPETKPETTPEARPERREGRRGRRGGRGAAQMQEQLGLSDEQVQKMDSIRGEMRDAFRKMREEGGGFDRSAMTEMREKMTSKMKEILTPEQQKKFDEMRSQQQERFGRRGRGRGEGRGRRGNDPARLRAEAVKALNLGEEASAVVLPVLDKIIAAQTESREGLRAQRTALQEKAVGDVTSDELTTQLAAFRKARKDARAKVDAARTELQELLTLQQEAKLVALGLLE